MADGTERLKLQVRLDPKENFFRDSEAFRECSRQPVGANKFNQVVHCRFESQRPLRLHSTTGSHCESETERDGSAAAAKLPGMDPKKWLPQLPLFGSPVCVYCGGSGETSDHTPPRCFLPRKMPADVQAMTVPSCSTCNSGYSSDEMRAAAVVCTVSFTMADREAVNSGGWIHTAIQRDGRLRSFMEDRLGADGIFRADEEVFTTLHRIAKKTAVGLLFFEFGRIVRLTDLSVIAIEHTKNIVPSALVESHRRADSGFEEVAPSGRELERQVMALMGLEPRHMPKWHVFIPGYFEFMFIRRSNQALMCAMNIHDSLTILLECPWPSNAGSRRAGKPRLARSKS